MSRFLLWSCVVLALPLSLASAPGARADEPALSVEEKRLQDFWHAYYDGLSRYYATLGKLDWVAYYKNHGFQLNVLDSGTGGAQRIQFAPVLISPQMQLALPSGSVTGLAGGVPSPAPGRNAKVRKGKKTRNAPAAGTNVAPTAAVAPTLLPIAGVGAERKPVPVEFKAVRFGSDEKQATKKLNDLAAAGWEYVGPLGNGMTAFRRPAAAKSVTIRY